MKILLSLFLILFSSCASYHSGKNVNDYAVVHQKAKNSHATKWGVKVTVK